MEMHQVRYFLALSEELNFTKAAIRCNVSQPSLTRAIRRLEDEFRGPLLHRDRGKTHLSELGKMVLPYLTEVSLQAGAAKKQAEALRKTSAKRLRFGVMCTIAPEPLLSLVEAICKDHPEVDLEILDSDAIHLQEQLLDGALDTALYCLPDRNDDRIHYLKVFAERMVIVLHPSDPLADRPALRLNDLNDRRYLNRMNCEYIDANVFKEREAKWRAVYRSDRDDWILAMVAAGMGFGFLPETCARHPGVVVRPLTDPDIVREVNLATVRGRPYSIAVGAIVREVMRNGWSVASR